MTFLNGPNQGASPLSLNLYATFLGVFLDVLLFGILIVYINKRREKKLDIKRWQEEIDDYRGWDEKEAIYRIVGNIKRLNRNNKTDIDLSNCRLPNAQLGKDFQGNVDKAEASLSLEMISERERGRLLRIPKNISEEQFIADLHLADLTKATLVNANLNDVNLQKANLYRANLQGAELFYANLKDANLRAAQLSFCSLGSAILDGAILYDANLEGARCLTIDQLSKVKTLYNAKLDPELYQKIKEQYPHLFEKPKRGRPRPGAGRPPVRDACEER